MVHHNGHVTQSPVVADVFHTFSSVGPLTYLVAFAAGILSFLSPCVLPLVPGYLSIVTGLDLPTLRDDPKANRRRILTTTALFIGGFAIVYVPLGTAVGAVGQAFREYQHAITRASGVLLIAFALFLAGSIVLKAPWLYQELRFHPRLGPLGRAAPVVLGAAFAFGWTPCVGPVVGSILTIAAESGRAVTGATLLAAYTLGLGVPFLLCGLALGSFSRLTARLQRHFALLTLVSAAIMLVFGVLLVTDQLATLNAHLSRFLQDHGFSWIKDWS